LKLLFWSSSSLSVCALYDCSIQKPVAEPPKWRMSLEGRKYSVTTGRFRASKVLRPLSGDEFEEVTVVSRPAADI